MGTHISLSDLKVAFHRAVNSRLNAKADQLPFTLCLIVQCVFHSVQWTISTYICVSHPCRCRYPDSFSDRSIVVSLLYLQWLRKAVHRWLQVLSCTCWDCWWPKVNEEESRVRYHKAKKVFVGVTIIKVVKTANKITSSGNISTDCVTTLSEWLSWCCL